jgi:hypothetical protein
MAITFPTTLDSLTNPQATDNTADVSHSGQHSDANDAIEALEAKVGVDGSAVVTSLDYLVTSASSTDPGHKHPGSKITVAHSPTSYTAASASLEDHLSGIDNALMGELVAIAEFSGAGFVPDGGSNNGSLGFGFDASNYRNYLRWTGNEDNQDIDIYIQWRLPPNFDDFSGDLYVYNRVSDDGGNTGVKLVEFLDGSGTDMVTGSTQQNTSWTDSNYAVSGGSLSPGDVVTVHLQLIADTSDTADVHMVRIQYTYA